MNEKEFMSLLGSIHQLSELKDKLRILNKKLNDAHDHFAEACMKEDKELIEKYRLEATSLFELILDNTFEAIKIGKDHGGIEIKVIKL